MDDLQHILLFRPFFPLDHARSDDGRVIPAGVNATFNMNVTFHDARYFPNPEKFDPERFATDKSTDARNPFVYIPFSAGPRNCIGQKYALLDLKTIITRMLLNFEIIAAGDEPIITYEIVSRSLNGVQLALKPRVF